MAHSQNYRHTQFVVCLTLPVFLLSGQTIIFTLICWPYVTKILLSSILIASSVANYVTYNFGIYIDSDMVRNVFETNSREALDLVTISGLLWVFIFGVIPSIVLIKSKIEYKTLLKELTGKLLIIALCLVIVVLIGAVAYKEYAVIGRNNREVIRLINPSNYFYATYRYFQRQALARREFIKIDPGAVYAPSKSKQRPTVFVMVLGETARAKNFSLNGYERETNPKLSRQDIINFPDVTASGTSTAISVPAIFSPDSRKDFNPADAKYKENMTDLIQNVGYSVLWRDNDNGCKNVCDRVPTEHMAATNNPRYCDGTYCHDEAVLDGLEEYLNNIDGNTFIVLHTMGSHGPTYYKRYPDEFKRFVPTCDTADIQKCSREDIINTYDNTILYTDHIVSEAIDILKKLGSSGLRVVLVLIIDF